MKRILISLLFLVASLSVKAQTFTFDCICTYVTAADNNCDICNVNIQSRLFKGLLIYRNTVAYKWIDEPFIIQFQGNNATFRELIPNGETITIALGGTPYATLAEYKEAIQCPCAGGTVFIAGPGIDISGDTISAVDTSFLNELQYIDTFQITGGNLLISLSLDSMPALSVTLPVPTGAETIVTAGTGIGVTGVGTVGSPYVVTNTSPHIATNLTYTGASSPLTLNSSTGTDVTHTAGTGISLAGSTSNMTITNTAPDQTVTIAGGGINVVTGTYPNFTVTGTEVDGSITNEIQTYGHAGTTSYTNTLSNSGGSFTLQAAGIAAISHTAGTVTITAVEVDGSVTNEAWTIDADDADTELITNQTVRFQGGGIVATDYIPGTDILTITGTEVDGSISNEGVLGVGAGGASSSTLLSTTSGANAVTINAAGILAISESTSANGGSITLTATEVDGSTTNELQTIANTSNSTSHTATLSSSGGSLQLIEGAGVLLTTGGTSLNGTVTIEAIDPSTTNEIQTFSASGAGPTSYDMTVSSGGTVTLLEGSGIDLTRSTNTITIASTGITSATGYINGGNSFGGAATIGLNDNFDWSFETNGTNRMWIDNTGPVSIGATQLTTAALNINGLQGNIGQLIAGGSGLTGPSFYQATGSGSGSTATVFSGIISMLNGNVEALVQNTSTSGTGGAIVQVNAKTGTGDPRIHLEIDGTTDWSIGIDNDDVDQLKLHKFASPSDNDGVGTIEFGYDGTSIGMAINKVAVGTITNGHYAVDALGKIRADQFANNNPGIVTSGVYALGTAAGTGPTLDAGTSEFWGNGGHLKFASGTSPTANGVICTVTLGTEYTFAECAPIMQGRSTNAGAFNYSATFNSATRVITFTLVGTLTASTDYEFNIITSGRN